MNDIKLLSETRDTVTLRRADFKNLVEAAEAAQDSAAVAAHRAYEGRVGWKEARRNYFTGEETRRLLDGVSPVRVWREKRGLAQRSLATAAQISPSYLAEIESGKKPGSADALQRLALFLEVPMENLSAHTFATATGAAGSVTRLNRAAERLEELAESGAGPDQVAEEALAVVAHWVKTAEKEGIRHHARAAVEAAISTLQGMFNHRAQDVIELDRNKEFGAARRQQRVLAALEAAIDALRIQARRL
jgi:transcriptional regulator with XRE-family HTH domain